MASLIEQGGAPYLFQAVGAHIAGQPDLVIPDLGFRAGVETPDPLRRARRKAHVALSQRQCYAAQIHPLFGV